MTFVNEFVSDEDIKKYDLPSVWMKIKGSTPFQYLWTINHKRNVFLIEYSGGREELSNHIDFALWWDGYIHKARLIKNNDRLEGLENLTTTWQLIGVDTDIDIDSVHSKEQVLNALKDALRAYRLLGASVPVKNHTAVFDF